MKPYYERDGISIYHGDALEILPQLPCRPKRLIADPPYTAAGGSTNGRSGGADTQFFDFWLCAVARAIERAMTDDAKGFVFCDWRTQPSVTKAFRTPGDRQRALAWDCSQMLVWDREGIGMGAPFRNAYEMIGVVGGPKADWSHLPRNIPTVIRYRWFYGQKEHHGAEKPVGLIEKLLGWTGGSDSDILLDPFTGSGSGLLAARRMDIPAVGIEKDESNIATAIMRLEREAGRTGLFA